MSAHVQHIPFDLDGGYEQWQLIDPNGRQLAAYISADRANTALSAYLACKPLPTPVFPEPGHGQPVCGLCGLPLDGATCGECR